MAKQAKKKKSINRSKRRPRKSSSKSSLFPGWIVGVVVLALASLSLALWLSNYRGQKKTSVPPYEEAANHRFGELVSEVELAIYQTLRELGVHASQVSFNKVIHRSHRDKQWDFTELEVTLSRDENLLKVNQLLTRNLKDLGGQVRLETIQKTGSTVEVLVRVEGILTHRLALILRPEYPAGMGVGATVSKVAIVIDDLGYDGKLARRFLEIDGPLSFSVLPHGTFSKSIARRIHETGREILLHLPMEPKGYPEVNPGVGALLTEMTDEELVQTLRKDLDSLPYVKGVNNHMGSKFCEYEKKLRPVIRELKNRGLFFLDSRTTSRTKAYKVAQQLEVPSAERNVFLDNIQSPKAIRSQFKRLIQLAKLKGTAIGIAHPHEATLKVLREDIPKLPKEGVELVPVSQLLH